MFGEIGCVDAGSCQLVNGIHAHTHTRTRTHYTSCLVVLRSNAMLYNPADNDVHFIASRMAKKFEAEWENLERVRRDDVQQSPYVHRN